MRAEYTILVDTREKNPLLFPHTLTVLDDTRLPSERRRRVIRLRTVKTAMQTGDYALEDEESRCLVERKGSLQEIAGNLLCATDRPRTIACLDRLRESSDRPVLFLEDRPSRVPDPDEPLALDALNRALHERSIELLVLPTHSISSRRRAGEFVARLLLAASVSSRLPLSLHPAVLLPCPTPSTTPC